MSSYGTSNLLMIGATLFVFTLFSKYDILGASYEGHFHEPRRKHLFPPNFWGKQKSLKSGNVQGEE